MSVYFIRAGEDGPVKIGSAIDPQKRIKLLQTGSHSRFVIVRIIDGDAKLERAIHKHFRQYRLAGEWFELTPELIAEDFAHLVTPVAPKEEPASNHASAIVNALGGTSAVAKHLGISTTNTVYYWTAPGRKIPSKHWLKLAQLGQETGHPYITVSHLASLPPNLF